jgi:adenine-specific DNA-methyltransferase
MDYIGSKAKLNEWLFDIIKTSVGDTKNKVFLDACSGSGAVSKYAAKRGYQVLSNDLMKFPSVIVNGSIGLTGGQKQEAEEAINHLNRLKGSEGYFYSHFCDQSTPPRFYFTADNAKRIDRARKEIDATKDSKVRDFLLYCGLEAMSRVSNTTGVQAAYLKQYKDRAKDTFTLKMEDVVDGVAVAFSMDILALLKDEQFREKHKEDVLYIDPPYNQRQYGPNYHLYETFVRNDNPEPRGMTGLRNWKDECSSAFCTEKKCLNFLKSIVEATVAGVVFVSYNSDGLLKREDVEKEFPKIKVHEREYRRYKADTSDTRKYNDKKLMEYVFEITR